jgi:acetyl esterase/lipase
MSWLRERWHKEYASRFDAVRFRDQGFAVLAFDYRILGESGGEPRQLIWIPSQLEDYAAAIEYVRVVKEIDPERIALWGTSLSGGHVAAIAAKDNRIACISAQCPLLDGAAAFEQHSHSISIKYMFRMAGHAQRDIVRSWLGLSPHKIPIVGKPGTIAHMADMDAWNVFEESAPDDFVNECCARIGIRLDKYRPIKNLDRVPAARYIHVRHSRTLPPGVVQKPPINWENGLKQALSHRPFSIFTAENTLKSSERSDWSQTAPVAD